MAFEAPQDNQENKQETLSTEERIEAARDAIRVELIKEMCPDVDEKCIQEWADQYAVSYNRIFKDVATYYDDILHEWDTDQEMVLGVFKERLRGVDDREDDIDIAA